MMLTKETIDGAAIALGCSAAAIRAVIDVETNGGGFMKDGRPTILFERHIMYRRLMAKGVDACALEVTSPRVVNHSPGGYLGGVKEYDKFDYASKIDKDVAIESCSWGLFQIMGFHWKVLGYESAVDFMEKMQTSEGEQLLAFVKFIKLSPRMLKALRGEDWATFARCYNGPGYRANRYDDKLAVAFAKHKGQS